MPVFYFDTSALFKLYVREEGSDRVLELAEDRERNTLAIMDFAVLEFRSAIRRRERQGEISASEANLALERLSDDATNRYRVQQSTLVIVQEGIRLIDLYALRTLDALQLAGGIVVRSQVTGPLTFVCADIRLHDAAVAEGFNILLPQEQPPP